MQFAADDHVELLRAMSEVNNAAATTGCARAPELAFLPNLMPTYVTEHEGGNVHMFSLVHQVPDIQQGWRLLLRGLDLKPLLCDRTTIQILELLSDGVDWKHLPGSQKRGSLGVFFHVPDPTTVLRIKNLTASNDPDGIAASLDNLTLAASAEDDRDQEEEEEEEPQEPQEPQEDDAIDIEVLVEQSIE